MVAMLAWPAPARAQLLPLGSILDGLLNPLQQAIGGSPLGGLLGPLLDPILDGVPELVRRLPLFNEYKLDSGLREWARRGGGPVRVIVTTRPGQTGLVGWLLSLIGGLLRIELAGLNALVADVTQGALRTLALDPRVLSISLDAPVRPIDGNLVARDGAGDTAAPLRATLGLTSSAPAGAGVGIAIIDSGIAPSADFAGRLTAFYDFTRGGIPTAPIDPYGHGTHVAGIIGASGVTSERWKYRGVGAGARLIGLRVLDANGSGATSQVLQAIEFAIAKRQILGIDVINLSLGHPIYESAATDPLVRAVERASAAGIVVVTAAGNYGFNRDAGRSGYAGITSPGHAPSAITVGAVQAAGTVDRADDEVAAYSSRGPTWYDGLAKPDLVAPGHAIVSNAAQGNRLYTTFPGVRAGASHMRLNGTSMAAATATGVVALVIEAHRQTHFFGPALSPNTVKAILQYTATPMAGTTETPETPDALAQGAGAINAPAAISIARAIDASRPVGADWLGTVLYPTSTYANRPWPWSQQITWRDTRVAGHLLEFHRRAWGRTLSWGQPVQWEPDLVIGQNVVWDHTIDWASNIVWGSQLVGTANSTNGTTFVWGYADSPAKTFWGNLAVQPTDGQTFVWGYHDGAPPSQP